VGKFALSVGLRSGQKASSRNPLGDCTVLRNQSAHAPPRRGGRPSQNVTSDIALAKAFRFLDDYFFS
jgi:hypothetical protein